MTSIPQCSSLDQKLSVFLLLDKKVEGMLIKYADRIVNTLEVGNKLQSNHGSLEKWVANYRMRDVWLGDSFNENHLAITVKQKFIANQIRV